MDGEPDALMRHGLANRMRDIGHCCHEALIDEQRRAGAEGAPHRQAGDQQVAAGLDEKGGTALGIGDDGAEIGRRRPVRRIRHEGAHHLEAATFELGAERLGAAEALEHVLDIARREGELDAADPGLDQHTEDALPEGVDMVRNPIREVVVRGEAPIAIVVEGDDIGGDECGHIGFPQLSGEGVT